MSGCKVSISQDIREVFHFLFFPGDTCTFNLHLIVQPTHEFDEMGCVRLRGRTYRSIPPLCRLQHR